MRFETIPNVIAAHRIVEVVPDENRLRSRGISSRMRCRQDRQIAILSKMVSLSSEEAAEQTGCNLSSCFLDRSEKESTDFPSKLLTQLQEASILMVARFDPQK